MNPRSVSWMPHSLRPRSSVFTARPAAISTFSTSTVSVLPPASTVSVTPSLRTSAFSTFAPASTVMPRFRKLLVSTSELSASSMGRMRGNASMSVTFVPKAEKISANSLPTAPAPMTAMVFGACSRNSASSELMTVVLLMSRPSGGMPFTREPVAITMALVAVCTSAPTFTLRPGCSTPWPLMTVTLCFFMRNSTPFEFCSATLRERFMATP